MFNPCSFTHCSCVWQWCPAAVTVMTDSWSDRLTDPAAGARMVARIWIWIWMTVQYWVSISLWFVCYDVNPFWKVSRFEFSSRPHHFHFDEQLSSVWLAYKSSLLQLSISWETHLTTIGWSDSTCLSVRQSKEFLVHASQRRVSQSSRGCKTRLDVGKTIATTTIC